MAQATAAELAWTSTIVRGTVISLAGDRWEEVVRGQIFIGVPLRTLRGGYVVVDNGELELQLGPGSVVELGALRSNGVAPVRHYLGQLTISSVHRMPEAVAIQAGGLSLTEVSGEIEILVSESATLFSVHTGDVSVRMADGTIRSVPVGSYAANEIGDLSPAVATAPGPDPRPDGRAEPPKGNAASANTSGAGSGNDAANGNGANGGNAASAGNTAGGGSDNSNGGGSNNGAAANANSGGSGAGGNGNNGNAGGGGNGDGGNGSGNGAAGGSGGGSGSSSPANSNNASEKGNANNAANGKGHD